MSLIIKKTHNNAAQNNAMQMSGFSLIELLLVVMVSAALVTVTIQLFDDFTERSVNRRAANEIVSLQNSAEEYVSANFTDLFLNEVPILNDVATITTADMIAEGFLPAGYDSRTSFRQNMRVMIRNVGTGFTNGDTIEVVTVSEDIAPGVNSGRGNERILDAARAGGPKIGVIVNTNIGAVCCVGNIQSVYGEWSVPLADYVAEFNRTDDPDRGYLAAYGRVSFTNTFNGDYLYRVAIPEQPQVNRMEADIDMNRNTINGVGVLTADSVSAGFDYDAVTNAWNPVAGSGNISVNGSNTGTGSFTPFALTIDQAINIDGNTTLGFRATGDPSCTIDAAGNVVGPANPAVDCDIVGGDFSITGDDTGATTNDLIAGGLNMVSGDLTNPGSLISNQTDIDVLGASKAIATNFETVDILNNATTDNFNAFDVDFSGSSVTFDTLQTGSANIQNSTINAGTLTVGNVLNLETADFGSVAVQGNMESSSGLNAPNVNASNNFIIGDLNTCTTGCP